jgi:hypothetical protein
MQPNPDPQQFQRALQVANLQRRVRAGANNFYWITGLSIINSLITVFNGSLVFVIGLGITQLVDAFAGLLAAQIPGSTAEIKTAGLALSWAIASLFALFGYFAGRGHRWAFLTGMILYGLDSILTLYFKDWFGFAFHLLILWGLFGGLQAGNALAKLMPRTEKDPSFPKNLGG